MTSVDRIDKLLAACNNWGRWGTDDALGTLNLVTSASVAEAAQLVREGGTVGMSRVIGGTSPAYRSTSPLHLMVEVPHDSGDQLRGTSSDWVGLAPHGFAVTHLDALCHQSWRGGLYNGRTTASVSTRSGARALNLEPFANGLFAPAVLLDLPLLLGRRWLDPAEEVDAATLERAVDRFEARPGPGDVLIIRTGRDERERDSRPDDPITVGSPGLGIEACRWLAETDVSILVTDVQADVMNPAARPYLMPVHILCLVGLGIHLVDNARLDTVAATCSRLQRWRFGISLAPLNLKHATGSALTPIALF